MRGTVRSRLLVLAIASVALVGVGVSPASAAPVADQTQTVTPIGVIAASSITSAATQVDLGSTFVAGLAGSLTRIDIPIAGYHLAGTPLDAQLRLWNVDGSGKPIGAALATQVIPQATLAALGLPGTLSTTFRAPATVTAGTTYAFTVGFVLGSGTLSSILDMRNGASAVGKTVVEINGGFANLPGWGISFTTYVDTTPPAAPAPGLAKTGFDAQPYLVLAGGLLGLGVIAFGISSALRRCKA